jgi:hypothetical protein
VDKGSRGLFDGRRFDSHKPSIRTTTEVATNLKPRQGEGKPVPVKETHGDKSDKKQQKKEGTGGDPPEDQSLSSVVLGLRPRARVVVDQRNLNGKITLRSTYKLNNITLEAGTTLAYGNILQIRPISKGRSSEIWK